MPRTDAVVAEIVGRRPFAVLGYSAEDAVWCPACLRRAGGLSPGRADTWGQPIVPLFARDATVREEICENCDRSLYELLAAGRTATEPIGGTAQLRVHGKRSALEFDRVPPVEVRTALKCTGWRWDPRLRVWWSSEEVPPVPAGVGLSPRESPPATPKDPIVRRGSRSGAAPRVPASTPFAAACEDRRYAGLAGESLRGGQGSTG